MPDRALAAAFGGVADFLKMNRGLHQETEDREQKKTAFESGQARDKAVTEGALLANDRERAAAARQPKLDADNDFDAAIRRMGGLQNLTEEHFATWAGTDQARLAQVPGLRKAAAEAGARVKAADEAAAAASELTRLNTEAARLKKPQLEQEATNFAEANRWIIEHPEADPLDNDLAARMYALAGKSAPPSYARTKRDQLTLAQATKSNPGDYVRAQHEAADADYAETLPANVPLKAAKIFDTLYPTFQSNINNSLTEIERMRRDLASPEKQSLLTRQQGGGPSAAQQQNAQDLVRLSGALHTEADNIVLQMQQAGVLTPEAERWARTKLRGALVRVPKYWKDPKTGAMTDGSTPVGPGAVTKPPPGKGLTGQPGQPHP